MAIIDRAGWGAAAPTKAVGNVPAPERYGLTVHFNGPAMRLSNDHSKCAGAVRGIQRYHQNTKGWSDAAYSFMFCQHGDIFMVRGLAWSQFANGADEVGENNGADTRWYTAMWLGGIGETPTAEATAAVATLAALVRFLGAGDRVLPHSDFKHKDCPGPELTDWCRRWDMRPFESAPTEAPKVDDVELTDQVTVRGTPQPLAGVFPWTLEAVDRLEQTAIPTLAAAVARVESAVAGLGVVPSLGAIPTAALLAELASRIS